MKRECNLERALLGKALCTPDLSQMFLKLADSPLHVPILKRDDGVTGVKKGKERKGKERGMKRKKHVRMRGKVRRVPTHSKLPMVQMPR